MERMKNSMLVEVIAFILIALTFLVLLPFLDFFNSIAFIYINSFYFLYQSPYHFLPYPAPPNSSFFTLPAFFIFLRMNYNILVFSFSIKLFALLSTIISSYILHEILLKLNINKRIAHTAFLLFLFSPILFLVNYVNMEQDIFPIMFSLLAFLIYLNTENYANNKTLGRITYTFILVFATFMYFFPILILIAIVPYSKRFSDTIIKGFFALTFFTLFLLAFHFSGIWNLINPNSAIGSGRNSVFSIFYIVGIPSRSTPFVIYFEFVFILLIIIVTFLFSHFKIPIYLELSLTFTLLLFLIQIYSVDEYIWVLPFYIISFAKLTNSKHMWIKLLTLQVYFIPFEIVYNIYAGRIGMGSGIFYLSYLFNHNSTYLLYTVPHAIYISKILDILSYISMAIILVYIFFRFFHSDIKLNRKSDYNVISEDSKVLFRENPANSQHKFSQSSLSTKNAIFGKISIILAVILLLSLSVSPLFSNSTLNGNEVPLGIFDPIPTAYNSSTTFELINHGKSIIISPTNSIYGSTYFERNISGIKLFLDMNVSVDKFNGELFNTTILNLPGISVSAFSYINLSNLVILAPNVTLNVNEFHNVSSYTWGSNHLEIYSMVGTSEIYYNNLTNLIHTGKNIIFFFQQTKILQHQNILLRLKNGGQTYSVSQYNNKFFYSMSPQYGVWISQNMTIPGLQTWNVADLVFRDGSLYFDVNGYEIGNFPLYNTTAPLELHLGEFSTNLVDPYNYSYYGYISNICYGTNEQTSTGFSIISSNSTSFLSLNKQYIDLNLKTYSGLYSSVNNVSVNYVFSKLNYRMLRNPSIYFGALSYSPYYLNFTINSFVLGSSDNNKILVITLLIDYPIPVMIIGIYFNYYRKTPILIKKHFRI
jgi:hypothetical protein